MMDSESDWSVSGRRVGLVRAALLGWFGIGVCMGPLLAAPEDDEALKDGEVVKQLKRDGFVITDKSYRQGFSAYLTGKPAFITSDSLLMAYTGLLERVVANQQLANLGAQFELMTEMAAHFPDEKEKAGGVKEVRLLIGSAFRILTGHLPEGMSDEEKKLVEEEAGRVEKAEGMSPPGWWGSRDYLPYSRFEPSSTWNGSEALRRYFRYSQWMQSLPVDGENKRHAEVCGQLYRVLKDCDWETINQIFSPHHTGIDDQGILREFHEIGPLNLEEEADKLAEKVKAILVERSRLISPAATPEKALIDEALQESQTLTGLTARVGQALGNAWARPGEPLSEPGREFREEILSKANSHEKLFLKALLRLNDEVDERAPGLFRSKPWQRKQLNCAMGAWAEYRHAIAISQTTSAVFLAAIQKDPGYVEPVPEFFGTIAKAAEQLARESVRDQKHRDRFGAYAFALELADFAELLAVLQGDGRGRPHPFLLPRWEGLVEGMDGLFDKARRDEFDPEQWDLYAKKDREQIVPKIEAACQKFWAGDVATKRLFSRNATGAKDEVTHRAYQLALLSLRLESLARRQLAGAERSEEEIRLIEKYGETLGYLMFYEGNSYLDPRDDAPKIISIAHLGSPEGEQVLQCGTARPRQILVNYPDGKGGTVLCQGTVYAYRERIAERALDDAKWLQKCAKSKAPEWIFPADEAHPGD